MTTIKGVYKDGEITLLELAPAVLSSQVLITFIEDEQHDERMISLQQKTTEFNKYLKDTNEDLYQDYLKK